jgi:hypothetical protein
MTSTSIRKLHGQVLRGLAPSGTTVHVLNQGAAETL